MVPTSSLQVQLSSLRMALVFPLVFAAVSLAPLHAQSFDASNAGGPVTITAPWRFHTGDNPQWASANFDDSQWPLLRIEKSWSVQGYGGCTGYGWFRIRLQLPASNEPLALGLEFPVWAIGAAEIYVNGKLTGVIGQMKPTPN
jgi:hypothetical protein